MQAKAETDAENYACHCYTEAAYLEPDEGSWSVREKNEWRVFSKARHAFSLQLPPMIVGLVQNPKKPIQKVSGRHNFKMFHLTVPGFNPGERYYAFLKLEKAARVGAEGHHRVRLSIESAYPMSIRRENCGNTSLITGCGSKMASVWPSRSNTSAKSRTSPSLRGCPEDTSCAVRRHEYHD
jgi:hypothetical protein